ncbi:MAG: O-antigen ligase family protein [Candidatus Hydrogenedentales bacterium]
MNRMNEEFRLARFHRLIIYCWIVVLVLALFPLNANPVKHIKELLSAIALFLLAVSLVVRPVKKGACWDWPKIPMLGIVALWLVWNLVCVLHSNFKMAGLDELRVYTTWILIALFASRVFRETRHIRFLFLVICCAVFLSSVYGFMQYVGWDIFPWSSRNVEEYRGLPSTYANPNFAGHVLALTLILGAYLISHASYRWVAALMLVMAAHLYMTHMRGAPLALAAAGGLFFVSFLISRWRSEKTMRKAVSALVLTTVLGLIGLLALLPVSHKRSGYYFPTDGSLILRYNGYYGAAQMVLDNPIMGKGSANYARNAIAHWTPYEKQWFAERQKRNMHVHCDLLETAVESGVPGLFLHVFLLIALLIRCLTLAFSEKDPARRALGYTLAAFFMAFIVDGLFGFNLRVPVSGALFFLMIGVVDGLATPFPRTADDRGIEKKKKELPSLGKGAVLPQGRPRRSFPLFLCTLSLVCLLSASVVLVGEIYFQRGDAVRFFLEKNPDSPYLTQVRKQGIENLRIGQKLISWDDRYPDMLGHLCMRQALIPEAIAYYSQALALDPYHPHKAANLARAYLNQGLRLARASASPDYPAIAHLLDQAQSYAEQGFHYCEVSPNVHDVRWRIARAKAILAEEQQQEAAPYWEKAAAQIQEALTYGAVDVPGAYQALGLAYLKLNRPNEAVDPITKALHVKMDDESGWVMLEAAAQNSDNTTALLSLGYQRYAALIPDLPETEDAFVATVRRLTRAWTAFDPQSQASARTAAASLEVLPERAELWALLAGIALNEGDLAPLRLAMQGCKNRDAIPLFVKELCADQKTAQQLEELSLELARLVQQASDRDIRNEYSLVADYFLVLLPEIPRASVQEATIRANFGGVYLESGRYDDAEKNFTFAINELPVGDTPRLLSGRAGARAELGRVKEGMMDIKKAATLAPNDPIIQLTYARMLQNEHRYDEAIFAYTAAINLLPEKIDLRKQAEQELSRLRQFTEFSPRGTQ